MPDVFVHVRAGLKLLLLDHAVWLTQQVAFHWKGCDQAFLLRRRPSGLVRKTLFLGYDEMHYCPRYS